MKLTFKQKLNAYLGMTKRNMLMFLKDKSTIFFSMLAPIIVLGLYLIFLKDTYVSSITSDLHGLEAYISTKQVDALTNAWLLAGVIGTGSITVSLNSLSVMVADKDNKIDYDYTASPVKPSIIILSYFTGAFVNTLLINSVILTIGLIVLNLISNMCLSVLSIFMTYVVLILGCASATLLMMIIVTFFKKESALGAFSGVVSAAVGFMIGAYIPVGSLDKNVQYFVNLMPGSHVAALLRNYLMTGVLDDINHSLNGVDNGEFVNSLDKLFAFKLNIFGHSCDMAFMFIYIAIIFLICLALNIILYRKTSRRK